VDDEGSLIGLPDEAEVFETEDDVFETARSADGTFDTRSPVEVLELRGLAGGSPAEVRSSLVSWCKR